jgi:hypothetical protein
MIALLAAPSIPLALRDLVPLPPQLDFAAYYLAARALNEGRPLASAALTLAIVVITLAVLARPRRRRPRGFSILIDGALVLTAALIVIPISWDHYTAVLLVTIALCLRFAARSRLLVVLFLLGSAFLLLERYWRLLLYAGSPWLLACGVIGTFLYWLAMLHLACLRERRTPRRSAGAPP